MHPAQFSIPYLFAAMCARNGSSESVSWKTLGSLCSAAWVVDHRDQWTLVVELLTGCLRCFLYARISRYPQGSVARTLDGRAPLDQNKVTFYRTEFRDGVSTISVSECQERPNLATSSKLLSIQTQAGATFPAMVGRWTSWLVS